MKVELSVWAKTEFGFVNRAYDKSTSRHAISAHFYFGIHVRIVLKLSPKHQRISARIVVYDDNTISFCIDRHAYCSKENVDIFSKLFERNTRLDFDCPRKLVWNLLAPSAVTGDNANFGTIFVHLTEIRCLGGTHGNQHERAGSGSGKCRRDEKLFRGLHRLALSRSQKFLICFFYWFFFHPTPPLFFKLPCAPADTVTLGP